MSAPQRPDDGPDLTHMSPQRRAAFLDAYGLGYEHGVTAGRRQVGAEWREAMRTTAEVARRHANRPSYAELAERRGEHDRARAHRRLMSERGMA